MRGERRKDFTTKGTKQHEEPLAGPSARDLPFLPFVRLPGLWGTSFCALCATAASSALIFLW